MTSASKNQYRQPRFLVQLSQFDAVRFFSLTKDNSCPQEFLRQNMRTQTVSHAHFLTNNFLREFLLVSESKDRWCGRCGEICWSGPRNTRNNRSSANISAAAITTTTTTTSVTIAVTGAAAVAFPCLFPVPFVAIAAAVSAVTVAITDTVAAAVATTPSLLLEPYWRHIGVILMPYWTILHHSWGRLEPFWCHIGPY
jgi:hypothetical protein